MPGAKRKREDNIVPGVQAPTIQLRVQAFEADLVRDRPNLADALERRDGEGVGGGRGGLIRWDESEIWVDRFDARLLLSPSSLASPTHEHEDPSADVGWSDLPSDSEDTFFLTPREVADYRHEKRKREMEQGRLDRLKALDEQEAEQDPEGMYERDRATEEAKWGGSDEEPDEAQTNLMTRTAAHIQASPNPAQLEMRILANHGADPRFAFLRGRWKRAWARMKSEHKAGGSEQKVGEKSRGIGGLAEYESESESESESDGKGSGEAGGEAGPTLRGAPMSKATDEDETEMERIKAERRARALEWMRKRREGVVLSR
ncbi:hypothetical protein FRC06_006847 [Ceratobasidium sp. 370]|nr:hypothetical protein FRC06_006847 [Ceratobasidium sp. 370]